ncbi:MAG: DUF2283 domain-containing protein, partial [Candidatus Thiodiazotropha sp. (ex Dulcina madagascariensis)]|nr:DUF2283 domain-containing protein [Candidatus Thiodiazotropha sp. (ex Dulcina madagascariensis)]
MKMRCFQDADTLYLAFSETDVVETKDLDENTILDLDGEGNVIAITIEHASDRMDVQRIS